MRRILVLSVFAAACGGSEPAAIEPRLAVLQAKIFTPKCASAACHSTGNAANAGQLDLSEGRAYAALVNVAAQNVGAVEESLQRVAPGDAAHSFLLLKVKESVPVAYGTRMPQGTAALSESELTAIESWIQQGAPNN